MDFYVVLGLGREATIADIKRAYRRLARKYHPDINPGDDTAAAIFRHVAEAYEILSNPERRGQYDSGQRMPASDAAIAFEGFDFTTLAQGREAGTFSELFAEMFQPPASPDPP